MLATDRLAGILDPERLEAGLSEHGVGPVSSVQPSYVRYKPGESAIIGCSFVTADSKVQRGYARWFHRADRADEVYAKALSRRPTRSTIGPGLLLLDPQTLFYVFPNDGALRRLRWFTSLHKLKRSLSHAAPRDVRISGRHSSLEVLRYKPERRLVARVDLRGRGWQRSVLLRYSTRREAAALATTARHLFEHGVLTPEPLFQMEDDQVSVDEFVDGIELGYASAKRSVSGGDVAQAVATFHAVPLLAGLTSRHDDEELARALAGLADLKLWTRALEPLTAQVSRSLVRSRPHSDDDDVLVHGDLHAKNVLVDGASIRFVDLERAAVGSRSIDVGCLLAHAVAAPIRHNEVTTASLVFAHEMTDAYRAGTPIDSGRLRWSTAIGLVDQALLVARHLEPQWPERAEQILERADGLLNYRADSRWL